MTTRAAAALLLLAAGCVPDEGPMMDPFRDCMECHDSGGEAPTWTAAGTWRRGTNVTITDANGKSFTLRGNDAGNFYTAEGLAFPITVLVDGKVMPDPALAPTTIVPAKLTYGGCNACHRAESVVELNEFMLPGSNCLRCHGPGGMATKKFGAAGTFLSAKYPVGSTVVVHGKTATTNAVGNFFILDPIDFSVRRPASVAGEPMPDGGAPYGGCNTRGCHDRNRNADD